MQTIFICGIIVVELVLFVMAAILRERVSNIENRASFHEQKLRFYETEIKTLHNTVKTHEDSELVLTDRVDHRSAQLVSLTACVEELVASVEALQVLTQPLKTKPSAKVKNPARKRD